jgi:hypothetical protein
MEWLRSVFFSAVARDLGRDCGGADSSQLTAEKGGGVSVLGLVCCAGASFAGRNHWFDCEAAPVNGLLVKSRRTAWPFHIHNPERTRIGT